MFLSLGFLFFYQILRIQPYRVKIKPINAEIAKKINVFCAVKPFASVKDVIRFPSMPVNDAVIEAYIVTAVDLIRSSRITER